MRKYIFSIVLFIVAIPLFAQYIPPSGAQNILDMYSPYFMGAGANSSLLVSPASDALNPAASGMKQRTTIDLSYLSLVGLGSESGWGNIVNTGLTLPTKYGVFSGSARFIQSPFSSLQLGILGGLNLSFAKDLFPNLSVGGGISFKAGAGDRGDWGLAMDLGILNYYGDLGFLKDLKWSFVAREIGKGYTPFSGRNAFPPPFTPAFGANFNVLDSGGFKITLLPDISFPSFQDIRFLLGSEISYGNFIFLKTAYRFDLMELISDQLQPSTFPFSFGLTFRLNTAFKKNIDFLNITQYGWNKSEVNINLNATPMQNGVWSFGLGVNVPLGVIDKNPPKIELGSKDKVYISPNLDGVLDDLIVPLKITDERYVKGYKFIIKDSKGNVVRTIINKDKRPENINFKNIIDRFLYVKSGIDIPEKLVWNGKSDQGKVVEDGSYQYFVEAWDDNGNLGKSIEKSVIVDNTPPTVKLSVPYKIFSPNGDGNKDILPIKQEGSKEDVWLGYIEDTEGNQVKKFEWQNTAPLDFQWDGKNDEGKLAKDGVYNYRITSTDRAGNTGSAGIDNLIINTQATPINISIDTADFSPNGDGEKDTIKIILDVPVTTGIEKWDMKIVDENGIPVRVFNGKDSIPGFIVYDGKDDSGSVVKEGTYKAELSVQYVNGNNPTASSPSFTVDITVPAASVTATPKIFSPNGDGNKDFVNFFQETSEELLWSGKIKNQKGEIVKNFSWRGKADLKITWDGRGDDGTLLPDGEYFYSLESTDKAGNHGVSNVVEVIIDTKETPVFLSTNQLFFSPNADGSKDNITITAHVKIKEGIENYSLKIFNDKGVVVRSFSGKGTIPEDFTWDGLNEKGEIVAEGAYYAELNILYQNGNNPVSKTQDFVVDLTYPKIKLTPAYLLFSPDNDGNRDRLMIKQESSTEDLWEGEIVNSKGDVVRSFYWKGKTDTLEWDGKDSNGNKLEDGSYTYRIRCTDKAGNKTTAEVKNIVIDTRPTPIFVTVSAKGFSPNSDGYMDNITFRNYVTLNDGIDSWKMDLVTNERVIKEFSGKENVPETITWDGKSDTGKIIEGNYYAMLYVFYKKGNKPKAKSNTFTLDVSPPKLELNISPIPFSPDNDGVDDELFIKMKVDDLSPINKWKIDIKDPKGREFVTFSGFGVPSDQIVWNGLSSTGELVQAAEDYTLELEISDNLGNIYRTKRVIPVDVLVIREGNKLKIRISSITFAPNKADFENVEPEKAMKNEKTLKRLAEILKKYKNYSIRIEGHAVNLSWYDPVKAEKEEKEELIPLSLERAKAVKKALVALGIDEKRITTVGLGGSNPIVPFSDLENRWKDRRVEFILIKK